MFEFFLTMYRKQVLDFCGSEVKVNFDQDGSDGKVSFKEFENGVIKIHNLSSKHPNILKGVITGKKSWGLWINEWSDGIVEGSFRLKDILEEFGDTKIPEPLMKDFYNTIQKKFKNRSVDC
jgi:hypothetical protein